MGGCGHLPASIAVRTSPAVSTRQYDTATYRRNRKIILRGSPPCALCETTPATTADHIIPKSAGGGPELGNLQPACKPCNSRRGNRMNIRHTAPW